MRRSTGFAVAVASGATLASLAAALAVYELLLRLDPWRIPESYRRTLPLDGVDLLNPGVLERTPIEGVPLPLRRRSYEGPPFSDLERLGMVRPEDNPDPRAFPRVRVDVDARGLPNARVLDRADLLLVGDSYAVHAGLVEPPGLAIGLSRATGQSVYNLGVSNLGPVREAWLLSQIGLRMQPRAVVWLFFGGNDVQDAAGVHTAMRGGVVTWADRHPDYRRPRSWALAVVRHALWGDAPPPPRARGAPLPPLRLAVADGSEHPVWFYPASLRSLIFGEGHWREHPAWKTSAFALRSAHELIRAAGARLLVVYVPSKPWVYRRALADRADELHRMATWDAPLAGVAPEPFLRAVLENGGSLERVLEAFCRDAGIAFLSATPHLERVLATGAAPFYAADSHWNAVGQAALVEPIAAALRADQAGRR